MTNPRAAEAAEAAGGRTARMPRSARRRQLLQAAHEVFVVHGFHNTAMDEIAERAGVSKPVLYQHFPSKLELYLALLDTQTSALRDQVRSAMATTSDNHERVRRAITAYFDFVDSGGERGGGYRLVFESDLRAEPAVRRRVEANLAEISDAIAETIAADTGLTPDEAQLLSVGLAGLAEIAARYWLDTRPRMAKEHAVDLLVELAWRGISGRPRVAG